MSTASGSVADASAAPAPDSVVSLPLEPTAAVAQPVDAATAKAAIASHDARRKARQGMPRAESKAFRPRFFTKSQLEEQAPSVRAGMTLEKYARAQRQYTMMIKEMCQKMRHLSSVNFAAVSFCHHFYAVRSIQSNDWWLLAIAAVLLAGKTENSPRGLKQIISVASTVKPLNAHAGFAAMLTNAQHFAWLCDLVLKAERTLLYTVGFRLHFDHPHFQIERLASDYQLERHYRAKAGFTLSQFAANFLADSYKLTMSLRYTPAKMAIGALYSAVRETKTQVPALENGQQWFEHAGSTPAEMEDFYKDIKRLYASKDVPSKAAKAEAKAAKAAAKAEAAKAVAAGQPPVAATSSAQAAALPSQGPLPQAPGTPASVSVAPQQHKDGRYSPDEGSVGSAPSQMHSSQTQALHSLGSKRGIDATSQQRPGDPGHLDKRQCQQHHHHQQQPLKHCRLPQHVAAAGHAVSDDEPEPGELTEDGELPETAASLPNASGSYPSSVHHRPS